MASSSSSGVNNTTSTRLSRKNCTYQSYNFFNSTSKIPPRTRRYIAAKRKRRIETNSIANDIHHQEEVVNNDYSDDNVEMNPLELSNENNSLTINDIVTCDDDHLSITHDNNLDTIERNRSIDENPRQNDLSVLAEPSSTSEQFDINILIETLLLVALKVHHNFSYVECENIMKFHNVLTHSTCNSSKYHLKKIVNKFSTIMSIHHFCIHCGNYGGQQPTNLSESEETLTCESCNRQINVNNNILCGNIFLYISLKEQLKELFELSKNNELYYDGYQKQKNYALEDIYDGSLYQKNLKENMISVNFSIDGASVFNHSKFTIYPILCTLNELAPRQRGKNIMLTGLWFGKSKPKNIDAFLKPFVNEAKILYNDGFEYMYKKKIYKKQCRLLICLCDSVGRPLIQNSTQFNGQFGCSYCLHPGVEVPKGNGYVRVYPKDEKGSFFGDGLRSHDETLIHARNCEKGMKGLSSLSEIPGFDIINNLAPDWMHSVALGVCKQFANLWFDSKNHGNDFYMGRHIQSVDMNLLTYQPTMEISRTPRKMSERHIWRAHEWVVWLLFYSLPTLKSILPRKYLNHWISLVNGISLLLQKSVTPSEIVTANRSLIEFVSDVEILYSRQHVSFNVHLLTHLADSVSKWGPLWTHSMFMYENFNLELKSSVQSSQGVSQQICDSFRYKCALERLLVTCNEYLTDSQQHFLNEILKKNNFPQASLKIGNISCIGDPYRVADLSRRDFLALMRIKASVTNAQICQYFHRIIINDEIIHSQQYTKVKKRKNYVVMLENNNIFEIHDFIVIGDYQNDFECFAVGKYYNECDRMIFNEKIKHFIPLQDISNDLAAINVKNIVEKVMLIKIPHSTAMIACIRPNRNEMLM